MTNRFVLATMISLMAGSALTHAEATTSISTIESSINPFACDLYRQLSTANAKENIFFSPFSMATALAMAAEGARGQTAEEMGRVLHADSRAGGGDFTPLHADLSALADELAAKPVPPATRARIDSLRKKLDELNHLQSDDFQKILDAHQQAEQTAAELNELLGQIDQYEFRSANALWGEKSFDIEKPYLDKLATGYKTGGLFPVDFLHDPDGARQHINQWVAQETNDRIKDLLAKGQVSPDTRLVLTNAVYFLGQWAEPFDASRTKPQDFSKLDGGTMQVPLMDKARLDGASYAAFNCDGSLFATPKMIDYDEKDSSKLFPDKDGFVVAELPYRGGAVSMLVILPRDPKGGLSALERMLTGENLTRWTGQLAQRKINLLLPKFKLETTYDMIEPLKALGMKRAFVSPALPDSAQFDGISSSSDPSKRLYIGVVAHKAFVSVDEKGTEAAAATGMGALAGSAMRREVPFVPTVRADHPFLFLIREKNGKAVLFIGRCVRPA